MNRIIQIEKKCYDDEMILYKKNKVTIKDGVTVLVGCNGIGKSTFLKQIKKQLEKDDIPVILFDNLMEGGERGREKAFGMGNIGFFATAFNSSEGENIVMNLCQLASRLREFIEKGEDPADKSKKFQKIFKNYEDKKNGIEPEPEELSNERWILLDAIDSGLSVDNVVDVKELLFKTILEHNFGKEIYIVVSANEYELARNEKCFDVYNGKYIKINNYEEYRDFILKSKEEKNEREDKAEEKRKKQTKK